MTTLPALIEHSMTTLPATRRSFLASAILALIDRIARVSPPAVQPTPIETRVCPTPNGSSTAIYRRWRRGDSGKGGACTRCVECHAYRGACLMIIPRAIPRSQAADYSPRRRGFKLRPL